MPTLDIDNDSAHDVLELHFYRGLSFVDSIPDKRGAQVRDTRRLGWNRPQSINRFEKNQ